jgi:hypothetical protein
MASRLAMPACSPSPTPRLALRAPPKLWRRLAACCLCWTAASLPGRAAREAPALPNACCPLPADCLGAEPGPGLLGICRVGVADGDPAGWLECESPCEPAGCATCAALLLPAAGMTALGFNPRRCSARTCRPQTDGSVPRSSEATWARLRLSAAWSMHPVALPAGSCSLALPRGCLG